MFSSIYISVNTMYLDISQLTHPPSTLLHLEQTFTSPLGSEGLLLALSVSRAPALLLVEQHFCNNHAADISHAGIWHCIVLVCASTLAE